MNILFKKNIRDSIILEENCKCSIVILQSTIFSFENHVSVLLCCVYQQFTNPETKKVQHIHKTSYRRVLKQFLFDLGNIFSRKIFFVVGWPWLPDTPTAIFIEKENPPQSFFQRLNNHTISILTANLVYQLQPSAMLELSASMIFTATSWIFVLVNVRAY